jgi:ATP-dependent Zn protease
VLFEMPGVVEREGIWRVQVHPSRTPLADDVDFRALAERYEISGGDIRNAVLKAALAAAAVHGSDAFKAIHQQHFEEGVREVIAGKRVMRQSLLDVEPQLSRDLAPALSQGLSTSLLVSTVSVIALVVSVVALTIALVR